MGGMFYNMLSFKYVSLKLLKPVILHIISDQNNPQPPRGLPPVMAPRGLPPLQGGGGALPPIQGGPVSFIRLDYLIMHVFIHIENVCCYS